MFGFGALFVRHELARIFEAAGTLPVFARNDEIGTSE